MNPILSHAIAGGIGALVLFVLGALQIVKFKK